MSREDLDKRVIEDFIEENEDLFLEYLRKTFDSDLVKQAFVINQNAKYLEFKERHDADLAEDREWRKNDD